MREQAVVDRIVDGIHAVLLVGEEQVERVVPASQLPQGAREGTWLKVCFDGDQLVHVEIDPGLTQAAQARIAEKMDRLRARGRRND